MKRPNTILSIVGLAVGVAAGGYFLPRPAPSVEPVVTQTAPAPAASAPASPPVTVESLRELGKTLSADIAKAEAGVAHAEAALAEQRSLVDSLESLEARFDDKRISVDEYLRERHAIAERTLGHGA